MSGKANRRRTRRGGTERLLADDDFSAKLDATTAQFGPLMVALRKQFDRFRAANPTTLAEWEAEAEALLAAWDRVQENRIAGRMLLNEKLRDELGPDLGL
jgi:hypothetical protein